MNIGKSFQKFGYKEEKKGGVTTGMRCRIKGSLLYFIFKIKGIRKNFIDSKHLGVRKK